MMNEPETVMNQFTGKFYIGQIVEHKRFGYRGVIYDADPNFMLSEAWYGTVALSRPPKDQPWYHVLVDGAEHVTYVAERNLSPSKAESSPVNHPLIATHFQAFNGSHYETKTRRN